MLKRTFTTQTKTILECVDCKFYNRASSICKLNGANWLANRADENICGVGAKKFFPLNKTNLLKAEQANTNAGLFYLTGVCIVPIGLFVDFKLCFSSFLFFIIGDSFGELAEKYKKEYEKDNEIN